MQVTTKRILLTNVSIFIITLCAASMVDAATARISAKIESGPLEQMSAEENRNVSLAAGRILRHAYDAIAELDIGEPTIAAEDINKAKQLVKIIEVAVPDTKTTYRITADDLTYEDTEIAAPEIIPIFTEFDHVSLLAPLEGAKAEKKRDDKISDDVEAVLDDSVTLAKTSLDFNFVKSGLNRAEAALKENDSEKAKEALHAVLGGVRFSVVQVELPLERAQENLMLAKSELERGNKTKAKRLLTLAAGDIESYNGPGSKGNMESRNKLRDEINSAMNKLDENHETVTAKIEKWWDQIANWMH